MSPTASEFYTSSSDKVSIDRDCNNNFNAWYNCLVKRKKSTSTILNSKHERKPDE